MPVNIITIFGDLARFGVMVGRKEESSGSSTFWTQLQAFSPALHHDCCAVEPLTYQWRLSPLALVIGQFFSSRQLYFWCFFVRLRVIIYSLVCADACRFSSLGRNYHHNLTALIYIFAASRPRGAIASWPILCLESRENNRPWQTMPRP
jgi:hypothetical protein